MPGYRFYFLDSDDHIKAVETVDCADDAEAKVKAESLFNERTGFASIEVWREKDMVHQVRRA
jgi:hypothetical protein